MSLEDFLDILVACLNHLVSHNLFLSEKSKDYIAFSFAANYEAVVRILNKIYPNGVPMETLEKVIHIMMSLNSMTGADLESLGGSIRKWWYPGHDREDMLDLIHNFHDGLTKICKENSANFGGNEPYRLAEELCLLDQEKSREHYFSKCKKEKQQSMIKLFVNKLLFSHGISTHGFNVLLANSGAEIRDLNDSWHRYYSSDKWMINLSDIERTRYTSLTSNSLGLTAQRGAGLEQQERKQI
jgi:hypothetical protein